MGNQMRTVGQITREHGERVISSQLPGWDRLFACWDPMHSDGSPHFHLAADPDPNPRARSFVAMGKSQGWCAYGVPGYTAAYRPPSTHCPNGHEFTEENTGYQVGSNGRPHRRCRACSRKMSARLREKKWRERNG